MWDIHLLWCRIYISPYLTKQTTDWTSFLLEIFFYLVTVIGYSFVATLKKSTSRACKRINSQGIPFIWLLTSIPGVDIPRRYKTMSPKVRGGCPSTSEVDIPHLQSQMSHSDIRGCPLTSEVDIPHRQRRMSLNVTSGCPLTSEVDIPYRQRGKSHNVISGCPQTSELDIPHLKRQMFHSDIRGCPLTSEVDIPYSQKRMSHNIISGCPQTSELDIPHLQRRMFRSDIRGCTLTSDVDIPYRQRRMSHNVISGCPLMSEVDIPQSQILVIWWLVFNLLADESWYIFLDTDRSWVAVWQKWHLIWERRCISEFISVAKRQLIFIDPYRVFTEIKQWLWLSRWTMIFSSGISDVNKDSSGTI